MAYSSSEKEQETNSLEINNENIAKHKYDETETGNNSVDDQRIEPFELSQKTMEFK